MSGYRRASNAMDFGNKKNKYSAFRVTVPEGNFDSRKEYRRFLILRSREERGEISDLRRQVKFELIPSQREPDKIGPRGGRIRGALIERGVCYKADFVYVENGETIVEDIKGLRTEGYIIKRKLMLYVHGIRLKET